MIGTAKIRILADDISAAVSSKDEAQVTRPPYVLVAALRRALGNLGLKLSPAECENLIL